MTRKKLYWAPTVFHLGAGYDIFTDEGKILYTVSPNRVPKSSKEILKVSAGTKYVPKEKAKAFLEKYGVPAKSVALFAKGVIYHQCFKHFPNWYKFATRGNLSMSVSDTATLEMAYEFEEACNDGIKNIAPIIALTGMTTQELKKSLPKSIWKNICKNSYSHNRMIYQRLSKAMVPTRGPLQYLPDRQNFCIELLKDTSEIPYTIWKSSRMIVHIGFGLKNEEWKFIRNSSKAPLNKLFKEPESIGWLNKYVDTRRMATELNQPFNSEWTPRRMQEEHDRLVILSRDAANARRAKSDKDYAEKLKIDFRTLHKGIESFEHKGVKITALTNMEQVQNEGKVQRHCVGTYAEYCAEGGYLVYSLEDAEGVRSTLGIEIVKTTGEKIYRFSQHYLKENEEVTNTAAIEAAGEIIQRLQKENKVELKRRINDRL